LAIIALESASLTMENIFDFKSVFYRMKAITSILCTVLSPYAAFETQVL